VVLFGGEATNRFYGDTWVWNGTSWSQRATPAGPIGRRFPVLGWDDVRGTVLLLGGQNSGLSPISISDFWEWDGTRWTLISPAPLGPYPNGTMATAPGIGVVLSMGPLTNVPGYSTWIWDGATWTPVQSSSSTKPLSWSFAWDGRRFVCFSSRDNATWTLAPVVRQGGGGCGGATLTASGLPVLGGGVSLTATFPPQATSAFFAAGVSDRVFGSLALPAPLGGLGAPRCALHTSVDWLIPPSTAAGGTMTLRVGVPLQSSLRGFRMHFQALGTDPSANRLGVLLTNSLDVTAY